MSRKLGLEEMEVMLTRLETDRERYHDRRVYTPEAVERMTIQILNNLGHLTRDNGHSEELDAYKNRTYRLAGL